MKNKKSKEKKIVTDNSKENTKKSEQKDTNTSNKDSNKNLVGFPYFSYTNPDIAKQGHVEDASKKNFVIFSSDEKCFIEINSSVLTDNTKALLSAAQSSKSKITNFHLSKKVHQSSLNLLKDYLYYGKLDNVNEKDIMDLVGIADTIGDEKLFLALSDHLSEYVFSNSEDIKLPESSLFSSISFLVFLSFGIFVFINVFFSRIVEKLERENMLLEEKLVVYRKQYNALVLKNKEDNQQVTQEVSKHKDYKEENNRNLELLLKELNTITTKINSQRKDNEDLMKSLIKKELANLNNDITKKQDIANFEYLENVEKLKRKELERLGESAFKYYYHYNERQQTDIKSYDYDYNYNTTYIDNLYEEIKQNTSLVYSEYDDIPYYKKSLKEVNKKINSAKKMWRDYLFSKKNHYDEKRREVLAKVSSSDKQHLKSLLLKTHKSLINHNEYLKNMLSQGFENNEFYNMLFEKFGNRNFLYHSIVDSYRHTTFSALKEAIFSLKNKRNLLIYFITKNNRLMGGYLSKPIEEFNIPVNDISSMQDKNAFIFNYHNKTDIKEIYSALPYGSFHFQVFKTADYTIDFSFGNSRRDEGLIFSIRDPKSSGMDTFYSINMSYQSSDYQSQNYSKNFDRPVKKFKFPAEDLNESQDFFDVRVFKIYELTFLDDEDVINN